MVDPPSSPTPDRGPSGPVDECSSGGVSAARAEAERIVAEAEITAEQRTDRVLAEAQDRLDAVLEAERASHARLRQAVDEVAATIEQLEQGTYAEVPAEPETTIDDGQVQPGVDASLPSDVEPGTTDAPRSMFPKLGASERALIDTITNAIRTKINTD